MIKKVEEVIIDFRWISDYKWMLIYYEVFVKEKVAIMSFFKLGLYEKI